jgi:propanol-preferring alcohol dehydrogenase
MRAMVMKRAGRPLEPEERPVPEPGPGQVRLRIEACAVCRTDLHLVDGELPQCRVPVVPGHEIVGVVDARGAGAQAALGTRLGVPWLAGACGSCAYCRRGEENLCDRARFTGCHVDGGYAEYTLADERFCVVIPEDLDSAHAAPLLCAGLIGYRALRMTGEADRLGLYGFGAAAHIVAQIARHQGREVYAFTRAGDANAQELAHSFGAAWAGASEERPPRELDAAIIFAPVGALVPLALRAVRKGGIVVCGGIHMSDIPQFPYELLWGERQVRSVANLTRRDAEEFMAIAPRVPVRTHVERYSLEDANAALERLRRGEVIGAAVLVMSGRA